VIKKPRGRAGHNPRWTAGPEKIIIIIIIIIIILCKKIRGAQKLKAHCCK
jgi:hypothetical protein